jgi:hypothetical protein
MSGPDLRRGGHYGVRVNTTLKKESGFATRESRTRAVSFERLPKKEAGVLHAYGVALRRKEKREND